MKRYICVSIGVAVSIVAVIVILGFKNTHFGSTVQAAQHKDVRVGLATVEKILERYWYLRPPKGEEKSLGCNKLSEDVDFNGCPAHRIVYFLDGYPFGAMPTVSVYTDRETKTHFLGLKTTTYSSALWKNSADDVVQNKRHTRMVQLIMGQLLGRSVNTIKNGVPTSVLLPEFELVKKWKKGQGDYLIRKCPRRDK